jgi:uncharacterized protein (DUF1015 family)
MEKMKVFAITNIGWVDHNEFLYTHKTKTAVDFNKDVDKASKKAAEQLIENDDLIDVRSILIEVNRELLTLGYDYLIYEVEKTINDEGIVFEDSSDIKNIVGTELFEKIVKFNTEIQEHYSKL